MKKRLVLVIAFIIAANIVACGASNTIEEEKVESGLFVEEEQGAKIPYTNLIEVADMDELSSALLNNGVNDSNVEKILNSITNYNETIGAELLTSDGNIDLSSPLQYYDESMIDEMWRKDNESFIGYNSRLTAFEIMKDFIDVKELSKGDSSALYLDKDALEYSTDNYFTDDEVLKFETLYSSIETISSTDVNEQIDIQKKYWDSVGVTFNNSENISLISVYIHNHFSEDENELLIGHTGILMNTDKGYIFFEKLSFQLPYQMIVFNSKDEVKQYLMALYDVDQTGECAKAFILENGNVME